MASWYSVGLAALLYILYQWIYSRPLNMDKPQLPSVLVLIAVMDMIAHNVYIHKVLTRSYEPFKFLYEVAFGIFYLDIGMRDIWTGLETQIIVLIQRTLTGLELVSEENYLRHKQYWIGSITLPLSLLILVLAGKSTKHFQLILEAVLGSSVKCTQKSKKTLKNKKHRQAAT
ncbi:uncharacterized protein LOC111065401 [Drosophila obscura]|uniref:uncharacterized protein LOC111065401 n=1 Tax=Drosophila obscura TaxID=7282 RepID=UPI001BB0EFA7|nr:uncharacterized protein LOC111065401 [Drosophila obscura]